MRIGIYVDVAKDKEPRGVGYHVLRLLSALASIDQVNEYYLYYQQNVFASRIRPPFPEQANFYLRPVRFPEGWTDNHPTLWWKWWLPRVLRRDRIDVFHGPNHFVPIRGNIPSIVTIHDVAYFKMDLYSAGITDTLKQWTRQSLASSRYVVAISKNTWKDIEELGVPASKLRLIYGGGNIVPDDQIQYQRTEELRRKFNLPEQYIAYVGTLGLRKNLQFLLKSYAALKARQPELPTKLVLVGKPFTGFEDLEELIRTLGIEGDVTITGYVEAWQIPLFYKLARAFVLPTLYEGFTLTTIESMAYGTPVIATDTSSIREGVGEAALLVEVDDVPALTIAIERILTDEPLRQELIEKGKRQSQLFTWEKCARETIAVYSEAFRDGIAGNRR